jgi:hypothetical protein
VAFRNGDPQFLVTELNPESESGARMQHRIRDEFARQQACVIAEFGEDALVGEE